MIVADLYFFFFKQKTAYEMRISDWSSDVCSSDLRRAAVHAGRIRFGNADARSKHQPRAGHGDRTGEGFQFHGLHAPDPACVRRQSPMTMEAELSVPLPGLGMKSSWNSGLNSHFACQFWILSRRSPCSLFNEIGSTHVTTPVPNAQLG